MKKTGNYLLDTNIISDINNEVPATLAILASAQELFTSVIVAGELFYGIENSTKKEENLRFYTDFFETCTVLDLTFETASLYGRIKTNLKHKGKPIPENDIWMSAVALQHDLTLLSRDQHFRHVDGLKPEILED